MSHRQSTACRQVITGQVLASEVTAQRNLNFTVGILRLHFIFRARDAVPGAKRKNVIVILQVGSPTNLHLRLMTASGKIRKCAPSEEELEGSTDKEGVGSCE